MTKVNGDSIYPVLKYAEYQILHHAASRTDRSGAELYAYGNAWFA